MTISEALRAAAQYVEEHKTTLARDEPETLSDEDKVRITAEVSALGHDLDGLAAASETARVYHREYEMVKTELQGRGLFLTPEITQSLTQKPTIARAAGCRPGW